MYNLVLVNCDTDSIMVCKQDQSSWSKEEMDVFNSYINSQFPELIKWCDDGYFDKVLILKAKNYILVDSTGKKKTKGSALKDSKSSKKIIKFKSELIDAILNDANSSDLIEIYHKYVKETKKIIDIQPWTKKLTITDKIFRCRGHETLDKEEKKLMKLRKNETDVYDAIKNKVFQEGDKVWLYYNNNDGLTLSEDFNGEYDRESFLRNLYTSLKIFKFVIDINAFLNYTLKRNKQSLDALDEGING